MERQLPFPLHTSMEVSDETLDFTQTKTGIGRSVDRTFPDSSRLQFFGDGTVQVANNTEFGQILVIPDGKTLYTNTVDTSEDLRCINIACTGFWPPYIVDTEPTAGEEISGSLGTVTRPDGSRQVTYNQQPLYTFYLDKQPGDAKGDGFTDLGGTWHVVTLGSPPGGSSNDDNSGSGGYQP